MFYDIIHLPCGMGVIFVRKYSLDKFINKKQKEESFERQIKIVNKSSVPLKRIIRRERSEGEKILLVKAMMEDIKRLEREGIIKKNGRKWKYNI
ncbi:MAG: hypothetical protein ACOY31_03995 [Bacillota bacterium]